MCLSLGAPFLHLPGTWPVSHLFGSLSVLAAYWQKHGTIRWRRAFLFDHSSCGRGVVVPIGDWQIEAADRRLPETAQLHHHKPILSLHAKQLVDMMLRNHPQVRSANLHSFVYPYNTHSFFLSHSFTSTYTDPSSRECGHYARISPSYLTCRTNFILTTSINLQLNWGVIRWTYYLVQKVWPSPQKSAQGDLAIVICILRRCFDYR